MEYVSCSSNSAMISLIAVTKRAFGLHHPGRTVKPGGWTSGLPEASVRELERAWSPLMKWLGYELASNPAEDTVPAQLQESLLGERTS